MRLASAIASGIAVGLIIGASATMSTSDRSRRQLMRGGRRAMRKASHFVDDIF